MSKCIAPSCQRTRELGAVFCAVHLAAPAGQRGGWISAEKRRRAQGKGAPLDASNVSRRLWVGSAPPFDRDLPDFGALVLCAEEIQPERLAFTGRVIRCPIPDARLSNQDLARVVMASRHVASELTSGRRVLVTCAMGVNRSALVASLALARITRMTPEQLIGLMRARRATNCLSNPHFRDVIAAIVNRARAAG